MGPGPLRWSCWGGQDTTGCGLGPDSREAALGSLHWSAFGACVVRAWQGAPREGSNPASGPTVDRAGAELDPASSHLYLGAQGRHQLWSVWDKGRRDPPIRVDVPKTGLLQECETRGRGEGVALLVTMLRLVAAYPPSQGLTVCPSEGSWRPGSGPAASGGHGRLGPEPLMRAAL